MEDEAATAPPPSQYALLDLFRQGKRAEALDFLLDCSEQEINANRDGSTPLFVATARGWGDACQALLERGANPNITSDLGETLLMRAIKSGKIDPVLIHALLERYTLDINAQCKEDAFLSGWSALHFACEPDMNPFPEIIALLLLRGADPLLKNCQGQTPLDVLENSGASELDAYRLALSNPSEALRQSAHGKDLLPASSRGTFSRPQLTSNGSFLGRLRSFTTRNKDNNSNGNLLFPPPALEEGRNSNSEEAATGEEEDHVVLVDAAAGTTQEDHFSTGKMSLGPSTSAAAAAESVRKKTGSFLQKMLPGKKPSTFSPMMTSGAVKEEEDGVPAERIVGGEEDEADKL